MKKSRTIEYAADMRIDETALDVEWLEQTEKAMFYCEHAAAMRRKVAILDEEKKLIRARLIKKANKNPILCCGKAKPTAIDIEAYYRTHKKHIRIKQKLIEAQYQLDIAEAARSEISYTRKMALENLVTLHGQQYFAGPREKRNLSRERKGKDRTVQKRIADKMKMIEQNI